MSRSNQHDVIVVGAGPAGSTAAYFLARQGFDVQLLDKADFPRDKVCGDGLAPRALGVLAEMGVLTRAQAIGYPVSAAAVVSPDGHAVRCAIPRHPGLPGQCLVVPRLHLDDLLLRHAQAAGASFTGGVHVTRIARRGAGAMQVVGEAAPGTVEHSARLVIVATGASTRLLQNMGRLTRPPTFARAVRAYYEGLSGVTDAFEFHFPPGSLPGYAWIFPVSTTRANVGVIYFYQGWRAHAPAEAARHGLEAFLSRYRHANGVLVGARPAGPVRGYPLRVDFPSAPTFGDGLLIAGEAAGLVNPVTGEGIDLALESGRLAAEHAARALKRGDTTCTALSAFDADLRARFHGLFRLARRLRDMCLHAPVLNRLCAAAPRHGEIERVLMDACLGLGRLTARQALGLLWAAVQG